MVVVSVSNPSLTVDGFLPVLIQLYFSFNRFVLYFLNSVLNNLFANHSLISSLFANHKT